jgi:Protein of unknwon function (DUF3310)
MDPVNHPPHYTQDRSIEPIDVLERFFFRDALLWQVGKYLSRYGRKDNPLQDLQKAEWYLNRRMSVDRPYSCHNPALIDMIPTILHDWYSKTNTTEAVRVALFNLLRCGSAENDDEAVGHAVLCRSWLELAINEEKARNDFR